MDGIRIVVDSSVVTDTWKPDGASGKEALLGLVSDEESGETSISAAQKFVLRNLLKACLSSQELADSLASEHDLMKLAAEHIRVVGGNGKASELAEIFLYGVLHEYFGCLPACSKIFYKQNVNDPVKGADSVHVHIANDGTTTYWYGEAKFYKTFGAPEMDVVIKSVSDLFDRKKFKKENRLILNYRDLQDNIGNDEIYAKVKEDLRKELDAALASVLHVPILIIFEQVGADSSKECCSALEVAEDFRVLAQEYFTKHIKKFSGALEYYAVVAFHLILFPVSSKSNLADWFNDHVSTLRQ